MRESETPSKPDKVIGVRKRKDGYMILRSLYARYKHGFVIGMCRIFLGYATTESEVYARMKHRLQIQIASLLSQKQSL